MFFDIVDMTTAYCQYLMLLIRISPESYPDFYTKPFIGLKYMVLDVFDNVGESQRYDNPLRSPLPLWLPLDIRLQFFLISAVAPLTIATLGFLGLSTKLGYVWDLMMLGALFGTLLGLFLLTAASYGHLSSDAPDTLTSVLLMTVLAPVFVGLVCLGIVSMVRANRRATEVHREELRAEIRRSRRRGNQHELSNEDRAIATEKSCTSSSAATDDGDSALGNSSSHQRLSGGYPPDTADALDALAARAGLRQQKLSPEALAAETLYERAEQVRIECLDLGDCLLQFSFALVLLLGGLFFVNAIAVPRLHVLQTSTVFKTIGGILLSLCGLVSIWGVLGCFRKGRGIKNYIASYTRGQFISLTMIASNFLYTSMVTNFISLVYCRELVCEAGSRPPSARSSFTPLPDTTVHVGDFGATITTGCVACNVFNYSQQCPESLQQALCGTQIRQQRLVYDARVPCDFVDGYFKAAAVVMFVVYIAYVPVLQYLLAKFAVDILQKEFPLEQRFLDVLSAKEIYFEKVLTSKNSAAFVYRAYKPRFRYYKLSFLAQKIILASVSVATRRGLAQNRQWIGIMIFILIPGIALLASLIFRPFTRPTEAMYFPALQCMVVIAAAISLYGHQRVQQGGIQEWLGIVLAVFVVGVPIVTLVIGTIRTLRKERWRYELLRRRLETTFANRTIDGGADEGMEGGDDVVVAGASQQFGEELLVDDQGNVVRASRSATRHQGTEATAADISPPSVSLCTLSLSLPQQQQQQQQRRRREEESAVFTESPIAIDAVATPLRSHSCPSPSSSAAPTRGPMTVTRNARKRGFAGTNGKRRRGHRGFFEVLKDTSYRYLVGDPFHMEESVEGDSEDDHVRKKESSRKRRHGSHRRRAWSRHDVHDAEESMPTLTSTRFSRESRAAAAGNSDVEEEMGVVLQPPHQPQSGPMSAARRRSNQTGSDASHNADTRNPSVPWQLSPTALRTPQPSRQQQQQRRRDEAPEASGFPQLAYLSQRADVASGGRSSPSQGAGPQRHRRGTATGSYDEEESLDSDAMDRSSSSNSGCCAGVFDKCLCVCGGHSGEGRDTDEHTMQGANGASGDGADASNATTNIPVNLEYMPDKNRKTVFLPELYFAKEISSQRYAFQGGGGGRGFKLGDLNPFKGLSPGTSTRDRRDAGNDNDRRRERVRGSQSASGSTLESSASVSDAAQNPFDPDHRRGHHTSRTTTSSDASSEEATRRASTTTSDCTSSSSRSSTSRGGEDTDRSPSTSCCGRFGAALGSVCGRLAEWLRTFLGVPQDQGADGSSGVETAAKRAKARARQGKIAQLQAGHRAVLLNFCDVLAIRHGQQQQQQRWQLEQEQLGGARRGSVERRLADGEGRRASVAQDKARGAARLVGWGAAPAVVGLGVDWTLDLEESSRRYGNRGGGGGSGGGAPPLVTDRHAQTMLPLQDAEVKLLALLRQGLDGDGDIYTREAAIDNVSLERSGGSPDVDSLEDTLSDFRQERLARLQGALATELIANRRLPLSWLLTPTMLGACETPGSSPPWYVAEASGAAPDEVTVTRYVRRHHRNDGLAETDVTEKQVTKTTVACSLRQALAEAELNESLHGVLLSEGSHAGEVAGEPDAYARQLDTVLSRCVADGPTADPAETRTGAGDDEAVTEAVSLPSVSSARLRAAILANPDAGTCFLVALAKYRLAYTLFARQQAVEELRLFAHGDSGGALTPPSWESPLAHGGGRNLSLTPNGMHLASPGSLEFLRALGRDGGGGAALVSGARPTNAYRNRLAIFYASLSQPQQGDDVSPVAAAAPVDPNAMGWAVLLRRWRDPLIAVLYEMIPDREVDRLTGIIAPLGSDSDTSANGDDSDSDRGSGESDADQSRSRRAQRVRRRPRIGRREAAEADSDDDENDARGDRTIVILDADATGASSPDTRPRGRARMGSLMVDTTFAGAVARLKHDMARALLCGDHGWCCGSGVEKVQRRHSMRSAAEELDSSSSDEDAEDEDNTAGTDSLSTGGGSGETFLWNAETEVVFSQSPRDSPLTVEGQERQNSFRRRRRGRRASRQQRRGWQGYSREEKKRLKRHRYVTVKIVPSFLRPAGIVDGEEGRDMGDHDVPELGHEDSNESTDALGFVVRRQDNQRAKASVRHGRTPTPSVRTRGDATEISSNNSSSSNNNSTTPSSFTATSTAWTSFTGVSPQEIANAIAQRTQIDGNALLAFFLGIPALAVARSQPSSASFSGQLVSPEAISPRRQAPATDENEITGQIEDNTAALLRSHYLVRQRLKNLYWHHHTDLTRVQHAVSHKINGLVRRLLTLLFLLLGLFATAALSLTITGMLDTTDSNFLPGTPREGNAVNALSTNLAGYDSWEAFTSHCCCTAAQGVEASFPFYVLDVEEWLCENGKTQERVRRDGYEETVHDGYAVRALCGMEFLNGCKLDVDVASDRISVVGCNGSVPFDAVKGRW